MCVTGITPCGAASEPRVFSQVNDEVAQALRDLIIDLVPPNQELLIDAYCGAGFFAKALLDKFERVIGIDWDRFAIAAAKQNATEKETYIAGDVESELTRSDGFLAVEGETRRLGSRRSLTIIVDPPATGLTEAVRKAIIDLAPETLIYVSCNPPTLARDLKDLQEKFADRIGHTARHVSPNRRDRSSGPFASTIVIGNEASHARFAQIRYQIINAPIGTPMSVFGSCRSKAFSESPTKLINRTASASLRPHSAFRASPIALNPHAPPTIVINAIDKPWPICRN